MREIIDPLHFVGREPAGQQMTTAYYYQGGSPPQPSYPAYNAYSAKLCCEEKKARIEVMKQQEFCCQRVEMERLKQEIKLQNKVRLDMLSYDVYKDAMGRMQGTYIF